MKKKNFLKLLGFAVTVHLSLSISLEPNRSMSVPPLDSQSCPVLIV
jgi:hypothetical protein